MIFYCLLLFNLEFCLRWLDFCFILFKFLWEGNINIFEVGDIYISFIVWIIFLEVFWDFYEIMKYFVGYGVYISILKLIIL